MRRFRVLLLAGVCSAGLMAARARADTYADDDDAYDDPPSGSRPDRPSSELQPHSEPHEKDPPSPEEESLDAGGLSAPSSLGDEPEPQSEMERRLQEADRRDSERGLEFAWLQGEVGASVMDVSALSDGAFLEEGERSGGAGASFGGALGMRLLYFTLGARFRMTDVGAFSLATVTGQVGLKLPFGNVEPYLGLELGYASVNGLAREATGGAGLSSVDGWDARLSAGLDYYFSNYFSLGAQWGGDLLFLSRPAYAETDFVGVRDEVYAESASSVGGGFSLLVVVGFHL